MAKVTTYSYIVDGMKRGNEEFKVIDLSEFFDIVRKDLVL